MRRASLLLLILPIYACSDDPPASEDTGADASTDVVDDGGADVGGDVTPDTDLPGASFVINEVAPAGAPDDWFELYNPGESDVALDGYTFTDDVLGEPARSLFPSGATIPAGGYLVVQFDDSFPGFGLSADEELGVFGPSGELIDSVDWEDGAAPADTTFGRIPNGDGPFKTLFTPTPGEANIDNAEACGDGLLDDGEGCDDGNLDGGDGCDPACTVEDGWSCDADGCATVCGDGIVVGAETCDDGNVTAGDGCSDTCAVETSATVVINEIAAADPSTPDWIEFYNDGDADVDLSGWSFTDDADPDDERPFVIPDGTTIAAGGYLVFERDAEGSFLFGIGGADGITFNDATGATVDLTAWTDGDAPEGATWGRFPNATGPFQTLATPTRGAENSDELGPACGDGVIEGGEGCDDGNTDDGDGCSALCQVEFCGDGVVQASLGEMCDDGNSSDEDGCSTVCEEEYCGDGIVQAGLGEACDDSNTDDGDGCSASCALEASCGNGILDPGESCDDDNGDDGDGCDATCEVEGGTLTLVINEVTAAQLPGQPADSIELLNVADFAIQVSGWTLTDDNPDHIYVMLPQVFEPGDRVVYEKDITFDFGLGGGDAVFLYNRSDALIDSADWEDGDAPEGSAWARFPDGTGEFQTLSPSLGEENTRDE